MVPIKALLTGLIGVSICMANISGTVTDTGTTPISGAVVQLEKGGQTATTGADGSFTLVTSAVVFRGKSASIPNGLSAGISCDLMTVTIAQRADVEVATFDLTGKAILMVRKSLDPGNHSILLPYHGTGIYLYKVKSGNSEFVLKGNSVSGVSSGIAVSSQGSSSNSLPKQATAAIIDIITATKDGLLNYRCDIGNSDTSGVVIKMIANAGNVTDVDGNVYQTVKIGNQVWTVDNLRATKYTDGSAVPFDTTATWNNDTTPKYCFYKNTNNPESIKKYGALYNWYVVNPANPKKIALTGWHVPTNVEWDTMANYLITKGYNWDGTTMGDKIAKAIAAKADWFKYSTAGSIGHDMANNNKSGFSALPGGYRTDDGTFSYQNSYGGWWSSTETIPSVAWYRGLNFDLAYFSRYSFSNSCGFSVRLLKD